VKRRRQGWGGCAGAEWHLGKKKKKKQNTRKRRNASWHEEKSHALRRQTKTQKYWQFRGGTKNGNKCSNWVGEKFKYP